MYLLTWSQLPYIFWFVDLMQLIKLCFLSKNEWKGKYNACKTAVCKMSTEYMSREEQRTSPLLNEQTDVFSLIQAKSMKMTSNVT